MRRNLDPAAAAFERLSKAIDKRDGGATHGMDFDAPTAHRADAPAPTVAHPAAEPSGAKWEYVGNKPTPGYKTTPMIGHCQYCGTEIKNNYWISDRASKTSMCVGSECVKKLTGESGVQAEKRVERERRVKAHSNKREEAHAYKTEIADKLASENPHLESLITNPRFDGTWEDKAHVDNQRAWASSAPPYSPAFNEDVRKIDGRFDRPNWSVPLHRAHELSALLHKHFPVKYPHPVNKPVKKAAEIAGAVVFVSKAIDKRDKGATSPIDFNRSPALDDALGKQESKIYHKPSEEAHVFDRDGNHVHSVKGVGMQVIFDKQDMNQIERVKRGAVVTHNHPDYWKDGGPGRTFSDGDIKFAHAVGARELRAVSRGYVHSLQPPEGYERFRPQEYEKTIGPILAKNDRSHGPGPDEDRHAYMVDLAAKTGMRYTRTKHNFAPKPQKDDGDHEFR